MARSRRASYGEGSVYQRESDGKWVAVVLDEGKRRTLYGATRNEVPNSEPSAMKSHIAFFCGSAIMSRILVTPGMSVKSMPAMILTFLSRNQSTGTLEYDMQSPSNSPR